MVALSAGVNVAPSSQHIASCGALRQSRSTAAPRRAAAVVRPRAVAAPEAAARQGPTIVNGQVLHSATKEQLDVVASMDKYAEEHVLPILKPVEKCWQAQDFLPHPESPDFLDHVSSSSCGGVGWGVGGQDGRGPARESWSVGCGRPDCFAATSVCRFRGPAQAAACQIGCRLPSTVLRCTSPSHPACACRAPAVRPWQVHQLQQRTKEVPDDYFVCLVSATPACLPACLCLVGRSTVPHG